VSGGGIGAPQSGPAIARLLHLAPLPAYGWELSPFNAANVSSATLAAARGGTGDTGTAWTTYAPSPWCGTATLHCERVKSKTTGKTTGAQLDITVASGTATVDYVLADTTNFAASERIIISGTYENQGRLTWRLGRGRRRLFAGIDIGPHDDDVLVAVILQPQFLSRLPGWQVICQHEIPALDNIEHCFL